MSSDDGKTPREAALEGLPQQWRERLIERARDVGIKSDDDVGWVLVGSVIDGWAAASEAGHAAQSVQSSVDRLERSISTIPQKATQGVLESGRDIGNELQKNIRDLTHEQAETIRQAIDEANKTADHQRRDRWRQMLAEFNEEVASIETDHKQKIESRVAATAHEFAQSSHKRSTRRLIVIAAVAFAFAIVMTVAGVTYVWQSIHKPDLTDCQKGNNGAIWCRLSGSGS